MFESYLKLGYRNLRKYKLSSFINITGLALAFGCCIMVFEYTYWSLHQDSFNSKLDKLFVIERVVTKNGIQQNYGNSPVLLGPMIKNDFPQIKNIARLKYMNTVIKQGENVFRDKVTFVDDAFYKMFDFPVKWGDKNHFNDVNGIVLTLELSEKLFGNSNSMGKIVRMRFDRDGQEIFENFVVKGVFDKYPTTASFNFSALISFTKMASLGIDEPVNWSHKTDITFIEADSDKALSGIIGQNKKYIDLYNTINLDDKISSFHFQPLKMMNFHSYKVQNQYFNTMKPVGLIMLMVIAVSLLLLVYFNYINITIASASGRLKEISVRKVMGSSRKQIIFQFVVENLMVCTIAIFFGLFLAEIFFLPWFSSIANFELGQGLFSNPRTWIAALILIVVSALSGAVYPSFYISSLNTLSIMRGNMQIGSKNRFRKTLLGVQFFLTFLSISTAIAFMQETKHIKDKPWGYDPIGNVVITLDHSANYNFIKDALKANKGIESITGSVQPLGNYTKEIVIKNEGRTAFVKNMNVVPGFTDQLGMKIIEGRGFSEDFTTDQSNAIIVNQAFLKMMNWSSAIGKNMSYDNHNYLIVGAVNDFHYEDFEYNVAPMVIMACKPEDVKFMYIKTSPNLLSNAHEKIKETWQSVYPDLPFDYRYQEDVFNGYFNGFSQVSQILSVTSLIMTVISISGVFGLGLIILGKKMKEISIRKILGADITSIIYLIYKEFLFALLTAIAIGIPLSFFLTTSMFNQLSSDSAFSVLPIVLSVIALALTTAISVSWHIFKAYAANISQYLKEE